jgi:hypothetical protein
MSGSAIAFLTPNPPEQSDRTERVDALLAKRDAEIRAGMETWDYDRINADVQYRRGTLDLGT